MFVPVVPAGGLQGWRFLNRTAEAQRQAFAQSGDIQREKQYFVETIGNVRTPDDLIADRRLLSFALDAFGLGDDLKSHAFIRKVLQSSSGDPEALANRLADRRYRDFANAFGFSEEGGPRTAISGSVDRIVLRWHEERFETALGQVQPAMRIALNAQAEIGRIASAANTDDGRWYAVLGSAPLREFVQTALGLPASFATIDLDTQVTTLRHRLGTLLGTEGEVGDLSDPARMDKLIRNYFLRQDIQATGSVRQNTALALLGQVVSRGPLANQV